MSYILDALRRADAERERGEVPSLHTQQYGALPGDEDEEPTRRPSLLISIIVALVLALGSALAWNFWGGSNDASRRAPAQGTVSTAAPPAGVNTAAVPPPTSTLPVDAAPLASPAPALTPPTSATPTVAAPSSLATAAPPPAGRRRLDAAAALLNNTTVNPGVGPAAERRRPTRATAAASAAPNTLNTPNTSGAIVSGGGNGKLPEAMRRELPTLAFGGASYSSDPSSRMVIFNGRVFHEGDTIAPELVLQQIKLKAAVLTYKGLRYEIDY